MSSIQVVVMVSVTAVLVYALIALLSVCFYTWRRIIVYWNDRGVPFDEPHWLHGNLVGAGKIHIRDVLRRSYKKYKGQSLFAGFYFFLNPAALILDLDLVKAILIKDFNQFTDRGMFVNEKDDPLTAHLFNLDGKKWREMRHKLSPTFTSGKMKFMFSNVAEVADRFAATFSEYLEKDSVIEVKDLLARFTTDVIGSCAFGIECNSLQDPNAEFRVMGRRLFTVRRHNMLVNSFIRSYPKLAAKLRFRIFSDTMSNFFLNAVRQTVEHRDKNGIQRNDFINMLMDMRQTSGLTMNEMAAQVFVFFVAGFDTSSSTMGFSLYELAQNQEIQDRVRAEISEVVGDEDLTYESVQKLTYLDQVIHETLRKYAVIPTLTRRALTDYKVPDSKLVIEKETLVIIPADAIHHDPEIYPDPDKFDPERFTEDEVKKRHTCAFLPFGDGPRNCIGLRFGRMQVRVGLIQLLRKFRFSVCDQTEIPIQMNPRSGVLLTTQNGIYLRVENVD